MEQASASEAQDREWSRLPSVVVHLISEKLQVITDYVRFRAVCSPWRSASHPKPRHLPLQLPWLLIPFDVPLDGFPPDDFADNGGVRLFYDLWESKMRRIHLPEPIGKSCCASYRGWLLLVAGRGTELFLLNPLTRARVNLPSFTTPVKHIWEDDSFPPSRRPVDYLFQSYTSNFAITKVTFSSHLSDPNCIIMVFFERASGIFFCRIGDSCWTKVSLPPMPNGEPTDAAYHDGIFYLLSKEYFHYYDLSMHKSLGYYSMNPELRDTYKFFLVGKPGLYMVGVHFNVQGEEEEGQEDVDVVERVPPSQKVEIYQIPDLKVERPALIKHITDTSDITIFNGENYHYLAVSAHEWDSLKGGYMYMEYMCSKLTRYGNYRNGDCYNILLSRLNDGESQLVASGIGNIPDFWPPPPAMWFQPCFD